MIHAKLVAPCFGFVDADADAAPDGDGLFVVDSGFGAETAIATFDAVLRVAAGMEALRCSGGGDLDMRMGLERGKTVVMGLGHLHC